MNATTPDPTQFAIPTGTIAVTYAKDQPEYEPLPALKTPDGRVVTCWTPTAEDLARILDGESITIVLHTFNQPLQPMQVSVGGLDLA